MRPRFSQDGARRGSFDLFWVEIDAKALHYIPGAVPWYDELVMIKIKFENGYLLFPDGPGRGGTEVNGEAVRAHPPRS